MSDVLSGVSVCPAHTTATTSWDGATPMECQRPLCWALPSETCFRIRRSSIQTERLQCSMRIRNVCPLNNCCCRYRVGVRGDNRAEKDNICMHYIIIATHKTLLSRQQRSCLFSILYVLSSQDGTTRFWKAHTFDPVTQTVVCCWLFINGSLLESLKHDI